MFVNYLFISIEKGLSERNRKCIKNKWFHQNYMIILNYM